MFKLVKELFSLLTDKQRRQFYLLQVMVILMALLEVASIASLGPFMALVGDMSLLDTNPIFSKFYILSGVGSPGEFLFVAGIAVLAFLSVASVFSIITTWRLSLYAFEVGTEIASRLYKHYLTRDWLFHSSGSSAQLTKQVSTESMRITAQIILPLTQFNARLALAFFIVVGVFFYNPLVAVVGALVFSTAYIGLYRLVRNKLQRNGNNISKMSTYRFRLMNEAFGGVKDVILLGRSKYFIDSFEESGRLFAYSNGTTIALSQAPRYFMELIAFGAMIGLILILIKTHDGQLSVILPALAVYGMAGFKLLPALQQVYASVTQIKGNISAFEEIKKDLIESAADSKNGRCEEYEKVITLNKMLTLNEVFFTYPNKDRNALDGLSLKIKANTTVALVGASGSGKSTAVDIILSLISPQRGELLVDGVAIDQGNRDAWRASIGYVPQSIFLSEGTIAENIAFGIAHEAINLDQVLNATKLAHLDDFVSCLPEGLGTKVGERGIQLSGGQRQRIGIARALYNDASILVFDEATSALDGVTEKLVMEAIQDFGGKKTIIMIAHRIKTVESCDCIFYLENGQIVEQGTYEYLIENSSRFKALAGHP